MKKSEIRKPKSEKDAKPEAQRLAGWDGCLLPEISRDFAGARTCLSANARLHALADTNVRAPSWLWPCRAAFIASPWLAGWEADCIVRVADDGSARFDSRTSDFRFRISPREGFA